MSSHGRSATTHHAGFTLVELTVAAAVAAVLVATALPAFGTQKLRAGRIDAVSALTRVQTLQEQHRALHGLYASRIDGLRGAAAISPDGRYSIAMDLVGADGWRGTATARAGTPQAADRDCATLTVSVVEGFATFGPAAGCWNR